MPDYARYEFQTYRLMQAGLSRVEAAWLDPAEANRVLFFHDIVNHFR